MGGHFVHADRLETILTVAHLTPFPDSELRCRSGVGTLLAREIPALRDAGVDRQVVFADVLDPGCSDGPEGLDGVEIARTWSPGTGWWRVGDLIAARQPDVLHVQHEVFLFGGAHAARLVPRMIRHARAGGARVVMTVHGVPDLATIDRDFVQANGSRLPPMLVRRALRHLIGGAAASADLVLVHEERFADRLVGQYGMATSSIRVVPHPVPDPARLDPVATRRALGLDHPTALFFGFVSGYKGLPLLIDAWAMYRSAGGTGELVVAGGRHPRMRGDAAYEQDYSDLMARAEQAGGVRWEGFLDEDRAAEYLTACDVMVLPYRVGMAASGPLSHALAYGMPVLCSDVLADAAPDARGVFARDEAALGALLARTLEGDLGNALARSSRVLGERLTLRRIAEDIVDCYREALDEC